MYGKIENGELIIAPNPIRLNLFVEALGEERNFQVFNPRPEQYVQAGYLEVIEEPYPEEEGKYFIETYVEEDGKIVGKWVEADPPVIEPTPFELLSNRVMVTEEQITDTQLALCEVYEMLVKEA